MSTQIVLNDVVGRPEYQRVKVAISWPPYCPCCYEKLYGGGMDLEIASLGRNKLKLQVPYCPECYGHVTAFHNRLFRQLNEARLDLKEGCCTQGYAVGNDYHSGSNLALTFVRDDYAEAFRALNAEKVGRVRANAPLSQLQFYGLKQDEGCAKKVTFIGLAIALVIIVCGIILAISGKPHSILEEPSIPWATYHSSHMPRHSALRVPPKRKHLHDAHVEITNETDDDVRVTLHGSESLAFIIDRGHNVKASVDAGTYDVSGFSRFGTKVLSDTCTFDAGATHELTIRSYP